MMQEILETGRGIESLVWVCQGIFLNSSKGGEVGKGRLVEYFPYNGRISSPEHNLISISGGAIGTFILVFLYRFMNHGVIMGIANDKKEKKQILRFQFLCKSDCHEVS
jgi:hypothetical protein